MSKPTTCVEILKTLSQNLEGYPVLFKAKASQKEFVAIVDDKKQWEVYTFKSHGHIFVKVAKGMEIEKLTELKTKIETGY